MANTYKTIYRCEYLLPTPLSAPGTEKRCVRSEGGIAEFVNGFWINDDYEFTNGSDAKYWIPPTNIRFISKDKIKA